MEHGRGHRWARRIVVILAVVVGVAVVIRLVLDPVAAHFTRKALAESDAVRGDFSGVHVTLLPPGYEIRKLKLVPRERPDWNLPLFYAVRTQAALDLRQLLHGHIFAHARIESPKIIVSAPPHEVKEKAKEKAPQLPDLAAELRRIMPASVNRVAILDGEILYRDTHAPNKPEIWVHDLDVAIENVTTRPALAHGRPTTIAASGVVGKTGKLTLFVSADPFAKKLDFAGNMAIRGWHVSELYALVEAASKLQTPQGTLDLYAEWKARDGAISGGIKPVLKDVTIRPTEDTLGNKLKAWVADKGLHLFSDRVPGRNAAATVVPIEGRLDSPDVQLWPTVFGVVRNAFVEGVSSGFSNLPSGAAPEKQGPIEQARHAIEKQAGPPKAQPVGKGIGQSGDNGAGKAGER